MTDSRAWLAAPCAVLISAACGDDGGAVCGAFESCGGNLVGSWVLEADCGDDSVAPPEACPGAVIELDISRTASMTFRPDGTFDEKASTVGSGTVTYPASCLAPFELESCDDIEPPSGQIECSGDLESSCTCTSPLDEEAAGSGTFVVDEIGLILVYPTGFRPLEYCVEGDTLKLHVAGSDVFELYRRRAR